jgi:hypothetical protein
MSASELRKNVKASGIRSAQILNIPLLALPLQHMKLIKNPITDAHSVSNGFQTAWYPIAGTLSPANLKRMSLFETADISRSA